MTNTPADFNSRAAAVIKIFGSSIPVGPPNRAAWGSKPATSRGKACASGMYGGLAMTTSHLIPGKTSATSPSTTRTFWAMTETFFLSQ